MTEFKARQAFKCGQNCTQIVLNETTSDIIPKEISSKISACFEGGMLSGKTCGAVTGAYMALGLIGKKDLKAKFDDEFLASFKSLECKDILGYNLSKADELNEIQKQGLFLKICPKTVKFAVDFIEKNS